MDNIYVMIAGSPTKGSGCSLLLLGCSILVNERMEQAKNSRQVNVGSNSINLLSVASSQ
jgi:hypothetical protein